MSNCIQHRLRVAVQLTQGAEVYSNEDDDANNNNHMKDIPPFIANHQLKLYQSLQVHDCRTLKLKVDNGADHHKMSFDHVSYSSGDSLNSEVCYMLHELLLERRNCCLLLFDAQRDGNSLISLLKLLINEMNQRLEELNASIYFINLIYKESGEDKIKLVEEKLAMKVCCFKNNTELLNWITSVYAPTRNPFTSHETMTLSFSIKSAPPDEEMYSVKLSLLSLCFMHMDEIMMEKLFAYVMQLEKEESVFNHMFLTWLLKDHLEAGDGKLLLCDIPTKMGCNASVSVLLAMADKIYEIFREREDKNSFENNSMIISCMTSLMTMDAPEQQVDTPKSSVSKMRSISFNIPFKEHSSRKKSRLSQKLYCNKDLNQLKTWYTTIDDGFTAAKSLAENYYARKYDLKADQICRSIRLMSCIVDLDNENSMKDESDNNTNTDEVNFQCLYIEYTKMLQRLQEEVEVSGFAEDLRAYLCTKRFSLSQHILSYKMKQLEHWKQMLNNVLNEEITALNCLIY